MGLWSTGWSGRGWVGVQRMDRVGKGDLRRLGGGGEDGREEVKYLTIIIIIINE